MTIQRRLAHVKSSLSPFLSAPSFESLFGELTDLAASGLFIVHDGVLVFVNRRFADIFGHPVEYLIQGRTLLDLVTPAEREPVEKLLASVGTSDTGCLNARFPGRYADGRAMDLELLARVRAVEGRQVVLGSMVDSQGCRKAEQDLRLVTTVFESGLQGAMITDARRRIRRVNPAFTRVTGYTSEEVVGQTPRMLSSGHHDPVFFDNMRDSLDRTDHWEGEIWNRRKNGEVYPQWLAITTVRDDEGRVVYYVGIFTDLTHRRHLNERIQHLIYHDSLTELPNRRLLRDRIQQAMDMLERDKGRQLAVLFIDLDHFKKVNDSLGHSSGDMLLREVADRLSGTVRSGSGSRPADVVARLGGDEFVVLLNGVMGTQDVEVVIDGIQRQFARPFVIGEQSFEISASIGVAMYPQDGDCVEDLLKEADQAMYEAKRLGRNHAVFFDQNLGRAARERVSLEQALRIALEQQQFELHYQPQVGGGRTGLIGVEALLRWRHPRDGLLGPARFMHVLEQTVLMEPVTRWILEAACTHCREWQERGLISEDFRVSVNMSGRLFARRNPAVEVARALERTRLEGNRLQVEITETTAMENTQRTLSVLQNLAALGVSTSIDDFGTGYSSLAYLRHFPIDSLKIDRLFVSALEEDESSRAIAQAIIVLGHSLGMKVIAEGVETEEQQRFLRQYGCDGYQGFLYARPMPPAQIEAMLGAGEFSEFVPDGKRPEWQR